MELSEGTITRNVKNTKKAWRLTAVVIFMGILVSGVGASRAVRVVELSISEHGTNRQPE